MNEIIHIILIILFSKINTYHGKTCRQNNGQFSTGLHYIRSNFICVKLKFQRLLLLVLITSYTKALVWIRAETQLIKQVSETLTYSSCFYPSQDHN